jgi:hypothetical protein
VLNRASVLDVGMSGQVRAGRQLALADFTALGLAAPTGLWNLSDLTDASGNARALVNKGAVTFAPGINGCGSDRRAVHRLGGAGALHRRHRRQRPVPHQDRLVGVLVSHGQAPHRAGHSK